MPSISTIFQRVNQTFFIAEITRCIVVAAVGVIAATTVITTESSVRPVSYECDRSTEIRGSIGVLAQQLICFRPGPSIVPSKHIFGPALELEGVSLIKKYLSHRRIKGPVLSILVLIHKGLPSSLIDRILRFFERIVFRIDTPLDQEQARINNRSRLQTRVVIFSCTSLINRFMAKLVKLVSPEILRSIVNRDLKFIPRADSDFWDIPFGMIGLTSEWRTWLKVHIGILDGALVNLLDKGTIFSLFRLELERVLVLNSTFIQLISIYRNLYVQLKKANLQSAFDLEEPIGPRSVFPAGIFDLGIPVIKLDISRIRQGFCFLLGPRQILTFLIVSLIIFRDGPDSLNYSNGRKLWEAFLEVRSTTLKINSYLHQANSHRTLFEELSNNSQGSPLLEPVLLMGLEWLCSCTSQIKELRRKHLEDLKIMDKLTPGGINKLLPGSLVGNAIERCTCDIGGRTVKQYQNLLDYRARLMSLAEKLDLSEG